MGLILFFVMVFATADAVTGCQLGRATLFGFLALMMLATLVCEKLEAAIALCH